MPTLVRKNANTSEFEERYYQSWEFYCPACKRMHYYAVGGSGSGPKWTFNGDAEKPTFTPSLKYTDGSCHLFVTDGYIEYCSDCPHEYAGKKIPMIDLEGMP